MGRLFKYLIIALGAVFALAIVAAVLISLFVDPTDFRDDIAATFKESTGRDTV